jgi:hypothetical protein
MTRFGIVMDAADRYLKEAEKCERLAEACTTEIGRAFFVDAADHWRQMALEAQNEGTLGEKPPASLREQIS